MNDSRSNAILPLKPGNAACAGWLPTTSQTVAASTARMKRELRSETKKPPRDDNRVVHSLTRGMPLPQAGDALGEGALGRLGGRPRPLGGGAPPLHAGGLGRLGLGGGGALRAAHDRAGVT